jgi:hypothetical protein
MTINQLIDKAAAELVEQLLKETCKDGGEPWFFVIRRKLAALASELKERRKK